MFLHLLYTLPVVFTLGILFAIFTIGALRYRARLPFRGNTPKRVILQQPSEDVAKEAAQSRRRFLENILDGDRPTLGQEITEPVPGFDIGPSEIAQTEAEAQKIGLRWQLKDDAFLLLGRVMDALTLLAQRDKLPRSRLAANVRLVLDRANKGRFQVIIETLHAEIIENEFLSLSTWLGVSVAVQTPIEAAYFGKGFCKVPGGRPGCIGGRIKFDQLDYFVTCAHVVFDGCKSLSFRSTLAPSTYEPDVALLKITATNCFKFEDHRIISAISTI